MRHKKAQGLPVNVIVIAALALLVLVILIFIFSSQVRQFIRGADDCRTKQGECIPENEKCEGGIIPAQECGQGKICCVRTVS